METIGNNSNVQRMSFYNPAALDAFGRIRISSIFTTFNSKFEYSKQSHLWWEVDESGVQVDEATHDPNASVVNLPIPAIAGRKLIRQSKIWPPYQPGNSHRPLKSNAFGPATAGIRKRYGLFSEKNGVYLEQSADGIYYIVLRSFSSGQIVERRIPQNEWNIDTFSTTTGKNPSGINENTERLEFQGDTARFSLENAIILDIDGEWLGVGEVTVGFNFGRNTYYAHVFRNAGFNQTTYMQSLSQPSRYEIENITGQNTGSMKQICQTIKVEGGSELLGVQQVASTGITKVLSVANIEKPILFVRPRSLFYGKENRASIIPVAFEIVTIGNFPSYVEFVHEGNVTANYAPIDDTQEHKSASEYAAGAAITSVTGGHRHRKTYSVADNKGVPNLGREFIQNVFLNRGYDHTIDADAESYGIVLTSIGGAVDVYASITLAEVY